MISVVMPLYNHREFLDCAVRSVVFQTCPDWELVIVDDASTDGSRAIAEAWAERDPRIRVCGHRGNQGSPVAFTTGVHEARGEYVQWLSSDDALASGFIGHIIEATRDKISVAYSGFRFIRREPTWPPVWVLTGDYLKTPQSAAPKFNWAAHKRYPRINAACCFRREIVLAVGGMRTEFDTCADYALNLDVMRWGYNRGYSVINVPRAIFLYREAHPTAQRKTKSRKAHRARFAAIAEREAERDATGRIPAYWKV